MSLVGFLKIKVFENDKKLHFGVHNSLSMFIFLSYFVNVIS